MARNYSSTAQDTTLSSAVTSTSTSIVVTATSGFPIAPFIAAIVQNAATQEMVLVTAVSGTTLTVQRGYDGTTAVAHPAGTLFRHSHAAIDFREPANHIDAVAAHGATGAVMGTTNTQAVFNKDMSSPTNVFPTTVTGYSVPTGMGAEWYTATAPAGWLMQNGGEYPIASYTTLYNLLTNNGTVFPFGANTNGSGGAGSTHFRTPNRAGRVAVGFSALNAYTNAAGSDLFGSIGKTGGVHKYALSVAQLPSHTHTINHDHGSHNTGTESADHSHSGYTSTDGAHAHNYTQPHNAPANAASGASSLFSQRTGGVTDTQGSHNHYITTGGRSAAHYHTLTIPNFAGSSGAAGSGSQVDNVPPYIVVNYIIKT